MTLRNAALLKLLTIFVACSSVGGDFSDYFNNVVSYFTSDKGNQELAEGFEQRIPYEVSVADEKFISLAIQLTGVAESELDRCQHRVVLKLRSDCHSMNDEMLSKMAVALLNCQSYVEGRKIYPCTDEMSIKDCTKEMDGDAWNSYHLMSNRVQAVCYSIRQTQFRGLTENTINRLIETAKDQLANLARIANEQEQLRKIARDTLKSVTEGQEELIDQQKDMQKAQIFGQLSIENNIKRLGDEKRLIVESQEELTKMSADMQKKLDRATRQIDSHAKVTNEKHAALLNDLNAIREKAQAIFQKIEESSDVLVKQSEIARQQYEITLKQLIEVNRTVNSLVSLVGGTKQALEERLAWLTESLGGTDDAIEKLYLVLWHLVFLLVVMIGCAFLGARTSTRLVVVVMVPLNFALAIYKFEQAADPVVLGLTLLGFVGLQTIFYTVLSLAQKDSAREALTWKSPFKKSIIKAATPERSPSPEKPDNTDGYSNANVTASYDTPTSRFDMEQDNFNEDEYRAPTPPLSRSTFYSRSRSRTPLQLNGVKHACLATTRVGTPCKFSALPGRDYCTRHQKGSSIMG